MKIMLICNEYPPCPHGGIGTFVQTIARRLEGRGQEVTVVGLGITNEERMDGKILVVTLKESRYPVVGNLISRLRLRQWLLPRVKAGQIDVIEAPEYLGLLPFKIAGCAVVIRLHLSHTSIYRHAGHKIPKGIAWYEKRTLASNRNWIAVSKHIFESTKEIFGVFPLRSAIIYNPAPEAPCQVPDVEGLPPNYVLYVGQVSRRKGALLLAEAAKEFMATRPNLHLIYVGPESFPEGSLAISDQIRQIVGPELAERVHFVGRVSHEAVLAYMLRATVFGFPSTLEAFSIVVLEAMYCGLPVVCTSTGSGPEIIQDGINGFLADPTSPHDFSQKIARLLDDPVLARRLASSARKTISERFSVELCAEQTEQFYEICRLTNR
jgi:glycosyltransferase involved in cell wall biosynthesis